MYRGGIMFRKEEGESMWLHLHISYPWVCQQRWPYSEILILDPAIAVLVLIHQTKVVPTENMTVNRPLQPQGRWKTCHQAVGTTLWVIPGDYKCQHDLCSLVAWAKQSTYANKDAGFSWLVCEICNLWQNLGSINLQNNSCVLTYASKPFEERIA